MFTTYSNNGKPVSFPLNTSHVIAYLRAPSDDEALVKRLIARAFSAFERFTNGHIAAETSYDIWLDRNEFADKTHIRLPVSPIKTEIETVTIYDEDNATSSFGVISLAGDDTIIFGSVLPVSIREKRAMKIVASVGYTEDNIPDDILAGIEQMISFLYEARGDENSEIPEGIQLLWSPYVKHHF